MTAKEKYRNYCQENQGSNIFQQAWWLDAVCGENQWDVCLVEDGGTLCGALPYKLKKKFFFSYILMPHLTLYFNPILHNPYAQDTIKSQSFEKKTLDQLLLQLPKHDWINLRINQVISWQPFYWKGFQQTSKYAYTIEKPEQDLDKLSKSFNKKIRKHISRAEKNLSLHQSLDIEVFYSLSKKIFTRQNLSHPIPSSILSSLLEACKDKQQGEIFYAKDKEGKIHSASWVVWDNDSLYFLTSGGDPDFRDSGSKFLLYRHAIQLAAKKGLRVNCAGSMIENIAYVFRQFGAKPMPYHSLYKINSKVLRGYFNLRGKSYW